MGRSDQPHERRDRDRQARFRLPDPVPDNPERHRVSGAWPSHATPDAPVMMQVPEVGVFVRALLPVKLTGASAPPYLRTSGSAGAAGCSG